METDLPKDALQHVLHLFNEIKEGLKMHNEKYLDSQQLMRLLSISSRTLEYWRGAGWIPYSRIGNKFYYKSSDIEAIFKENYYHEKKAKEHEKRRPRC